jgi:hypothetical protein
MNMNLKDESEISRKETIADYLKVWCRQTRQTRTP